MSWPPYGIPEPAEGPREQCEGCGSAPGQHCSVSCPAQCSPMPRSTRCSKRLELARDNLERIKLMQTALPVESRKLFWAQMRALDWVHAWENALHFHMEEEWEHEETLRSAYLEEREEFVGGVDEDRFDPPKNEDEEAWQ